MEEYKITGPNVKYIGVCGTKGTGKSTFGQQIEKVIQEKDPSAIVLFIPFALGIKQIMAEFVTKTTPYTYEESLRFFIEPKLKEQPIPELANITPRKLMTAFGTDFVRKINDDIWIRYMGKYLSTIINDVNQMLGERPNIYFVVDDIRFENELRYIEKDLNGTIIFITKSKKDAFPSVLTKIGIWFKIRFNQIHSSEKGLCHLYKNDKHHLIINDSTIDALYKKAQHIIEIL